MHSPAPVRAFQWDLARQVERLDVLLKLLPRYADWGYQELYLHLEDAVEYPSFPEIARRDAYSQRQFERLVKAATKAGIGVVPIVNLLGHTQYLIKTAGLRDLNELRDDNGAPLPNGQLCPLHPRTAEVSEKLLRDMAPFCTAGKVHVGLDESFHLGKCLRCRSDIARHGLARHFADHVQRLHAITGRLGLRMGIWADMPAFLPETIPLLPPGIAAYDWFYYPFGRKPRIEMYNFAGYDLAPALKARGIEYWGCPMNGAFRYEPLPLFSDRLANLRSWWKRCRQSGAAGFLITSWEAYRLAFEMPVVVDAAAASLWLDDDTPDCDLDWLARGFERAFGRAGARTAARTALEADKYPFSGYARWDINNRWDALSTRDTPDACERERRVFAKLSARPLPAALSASLAWRRYLAERDVFVRRCVKGVCALRNGRGLPTLRARLEAEARDFGSALTAGRRAARAMWRRTREAGARGQNELILDADLDRLRSWQEWLRACRGNPAIAFTPSPVLGGWQLQFVVRNFAPAVQKIVVEEQNPDGTWREVHGRHTIEFQATAAKTRTNIRRPFAAPVSGPAMPLRISVRGIGQVALSQIELTNGVETLHHRLPARSITLGEPAPKRGFPDPAAPAGPGAILPLRFA